MKYIRTKDGIWLFGGTHHKGDVIIGKKHEYDFGYCFDKKDIIKQAKTIEELCDEFVFITENLKSGGYWIINNLKRAKEIAQSYNEDKIKFNCYAAIWTDKGLIYVAKMNDKGDLELL